MAVKQPVPKDPAKVERIMHAAMHTFYSSLSIQVYFYYIMILWGIIKKAESNFTITFSFFY